jgi:hypothetical protein
LKILYFAILSGSLTIAASAGEVEDIRDYYNEVKQSLDSGECGLYRTEVVINSEYHPYPALGNYHQLIDFYWRNEDGYSRLILVTWSAEYAAYNEYGEVLYKVGEVYEDDEEEVVFKFVSCDNTGDYSTESRWWYEGGRVIESQGRTITPDGVEEFVPGPEDDSMYAHDHEDLLEMFCSIHF